MHDEWVCPGTTIVPGHLHRYRVGGRLAAARLNGLSQARRCSAAMQSIATYRNDPGIDDPGSRTSTYSLTTGKGPRRSSTIAALDGVEEEDPGFQYHVIHDT